MARRTLSLLLLTALTAAPHLAHAEDYPSIIRQLENLPRSDKVEKHLVNAYHGYAYELMNEKEFVKAERYMKKAMDLDRGNPKLKEHLAAIYLHQAADLYKDRGARSYTGYMHRQSKLLAQRALTYHRTLAPAHVLIAKIEYDNQKMKAAMKSLEAARRIDPNTHGIDEIMEKVKRESAVETKFRKTGNAFFEVRYQNDVDDKTAAGLRYAMETARDIVGKDWAYRPRHKVVLLVYSSKQFSTLRLGPHWAGGLYDGKIRLPLDGEKNLKYAIATLFHEYTHAVIHDLGKGHCPRWLNEGLAEIQGWRVEKTSVKLLNFANKNDKLLPLDDLDRAFSASNTATVSLGYQQSHSVAQYLVEHYKYRRVRALMTELGQEVPFEIALRKACNVSTRDLERRWKAWLPKFIERHKS